MPAVLVLFLAAGPTAMLRSPGHRWDGLRLPGWAPSARMAGFTGLAVAGLEGLAAWVAATTVGWGLPLGLWAAHALLAAGWWWLLLGPGRHSAAFTVLCADWVALALAASAFAVFVPGWAWALGVGLAWLGWMGAAVFVAWQVSARPR